jgi:cytidyltransferase-like protein
VKPVLVTGTFDDFCSYHMRLLQEASGFGDVHVYVSDDEVVTAETGTPPHFPLAERIYLLQSIRYVTNVRVTNKPLDELTLARGLRPAGWVMGESEITPQRRNRAHTLDIEMIVISMERLAGFPQSPPSPPGNTDTKKVVATGCFDWFHSGHVRFFEEASTFGDLYVVVGHDENLRLLKGKGHPLFPQEERRYMVEGVRFVHQAIISTGHGWMDAEPEIRKIKPDIYIVNEDGDVPEKRRFCAERSIEYVVLKRVPKQGLPPRQSTDLRGY